MGGCCTKSSDIARTLDGKQLTVVLLGLDNAGKTTFVNTLLGDYDAYVAPSFGFRKCTLKLDSCNVDIFDLGGGKTIRGIWGTYHSEVHGVVYLVDAADSSRFAEARDVLKQTLADEHLVDKPVLVLANKQDLPTAAAGHEVAEALGLSTLSSNSFNIVPCVAKAASSQQADPRLHKGFTWLTDTVLATFESLNERVQKVRAC